MNVRIAEEATAELALIRTAHVRGNQGGATRFNIVDDEMVANPSIIARFVCADEATRKNEGGWTARGGHTTARGRGGGGDRPRLGVASETPARPTPSTMRALCCFAWLTCAASMRIMATPPTRRVPCTVTMLEDEGKGAIGGAVLGGLLAGPFGALFGSQLGASMGANARVRRAEEERIASMGLNKETIKAAQEIAQELADAEQSLEIVRNAERSQRNLLEVVDRTMDDLYKAAEQALRSGDEATARRNLEERNMQKAKRAQIEAEVTAAAGRVATMQASVASIAERANEIEQIISRTVTATKAKSSSGISSDFNLALEAEDPLLKKFRDLEGK